MFCKHCPKSVIFVTVDDETKKLRLRHSFVTVLSFVSTVVNVVSVIRFYRIFIFS